MQALTVGGLRSRWDARERVLHVVRDPLVPVPLEREALLRAFGPVLACPEGYSVVFDAAGLPDSNYAQKAFWVQLFARAPAPRRLAVHGADARNALAFAVFGGITRIPVRTFATAGEAHAWAAQR